jgi:hypothetical protein
MPSWLPRSVSWFDGIGLAAHLLDGPRRSFEVKPQARPPPATRLTERNRAELTGVLVDPRTTDAKTAADLVDIDKADTSSGPDQLRDALGDRLDILRRQP